jgi:hypothetical protein
MARRDRVARDELGGSVQARRRRERLFTGSCGGHSLAGVKREQTWLAEIEKHRLFKGCPVERLVRDEGVAGSNPATPTKLNRNKPIRCDTSANAPRVRPGQLPGQKSQRKRLDDGRPRKNIFPTPIRATLLGSNRCEVLGFTGRGHSLVLALCRALVAAGHDPRRPLHAYRGDVLALKVLSIGEGARFTVREDRAGLRFVAWEPFPRRVGAWVREKAEAIGKCPDQSDEPSAPPGAAVRAGTQGRPGKRCPTARLEDGSLPEQFTGNKRNDIR